MISFLRTVERGCAWFGRAASWTVPLLVLGVALSVLMVHLRVSVVLDWGTRLPLLGDQLTLNGLSDLHWHLFAILVMLGGAYTLHEGGHVSVDLFVGSLSPRTRAIITLLGDLFLLLPFAAVMTWFSWKYMLSAYASGEGSSYGGLQDRWLIKAVMPLGFGLLGVFGVVRALRLAIGVFTGAADETEK